ncbi:MAG: flagellar basal body P-ring protein FlgI, partial [Candidatus Hydrogenedentes bacterium]|nr:flagellar basal body P-ring protein FlgI [Candidatus Hydrogenedentota bacterium]
APSTITDGERMMLLLKRPDFMTANNIQDAINEKLEPGAASAYGAGSVNVIIPEEYRGDLVSFIASIQSIDVDSDVESRVIINERTGTIVVGGQVMIKPCQIAHGNLTIKVSPIPVVSQPPPLSGGATVAAMVPQLSVKEEDAFLMPVQGTSAGEVAEALNKLKVTPRDMISMFQGLREAGALEADLEIM